MRGGYHLVCGPDSTGRSALLRQYVSAPMHISKPWWDDGLLVVNAINSTAGLLAGDSIDMAIEVKPGGEMLVTSPSATRAFRMPSGRAIVTQSIHVAAGGWLEMLPGLFIPHAGSDYRQQTKVCLEPGARYLSFESFVPGRVASGEAWEFSRFENRFELQCDTRPTARETYSVTPDCASLRAFRSQFPSGCHGTCYAAGIHFPDEVLAGVSSLHQPECWIGCTRLDAPAIAVRVAAADNVRLTKAFTRIRELLHGAFERAVPALRRV